MRPIRVVAAVLLGLATLQAGPARAVAPAADGFAYDTPVLPQYSPSRAVVLNGVSCRVSVCAAVGEFIGQYAAEHPLIEMWTNGSWTQVAAPSPGGLAGSVLSGVSCATVKFCVAVGFTFTGGDYTKHVSLIEEWDGTAWTAVVTPNPGGDYGTDLRAVSCAGAKACTAVGSYGTSTGTKSLIVTRTATTGWHTMTSPSPDATSTLSGVSCVTATTCTAVGSYTPAGGSDKMLAERRSAGGRWTVTSFPDPLPPNGELRAVACRAVDSCFAVGAGNNAPRARSWDGSSWTEVPLADVTSGELDGVTCTAVDACTAVGLAGQATLVEVWDGSTTTRVTSPPFGRAPSQLSAVACLTATSCFAVGQKHSGGRNVSSRTLLALVWDGTVWKNSPITSPGGADPGHFDTISCTGAQFCLALGFGWPYLPRAQIWTGSQWTATNPVVNAGTDTYLNDVSCVSATACTAVGAYYSPAHFDTGLAETWDGTDWTLVPTPDARGGELDGVSCATSDFCVAVGSQLGGSKSLIEMWDGSAWTLGPTLDETGHARRVSCPTTAFCVAVGGGLDGLVDMWDGSTWTVVDTAGAAAYALEDVSCASATACMAVGSDTRRTLTEKWDGAAWSRVDSPNPGGSHPHDLYGVFCSSATACTAVGSFIPTPGLTETLALAWSGAAWTQQPSVNGSGNQSVLTDVSCLASGPCKAIGNRNTTLLNPGYRWGLLEGTHP